MVTEWVTRAECGRRLGVSAMRVSQYCAMGMPTRASDKRVPWPSARDWHTRNVVPSRSGAWRFRQREKAAKGDAGKNGGGSAVAAKSQSRVNGVTNGTATSGRTEDGAVRGTEPDAVGTGTLAAALLRKETALASIRELELEQKRGMLAPIVVVNAFVCAQVIRARDILMRIGPELRDRLAIETDPAKCEAMIEMEVRRALSELKEMKPV